MVQYKLWNEKTLEEKLLDLWIIDDIVRDEEGKITHIYLRDDDFYGIVACLIYPHTGNDMKYVLRAEFINDFDRWANCSYEQYFENEEDIEIDPDILVELLEGDGTEPNLMSEIEDDYIG